MCDRAVVLCKQFLIRRHTRNPTHTHTHTYTYTCTHVEGGDNRDANDGSSNNVMHFRSVLKLYKILPSTYVDSFVKGNSYYVDCQCCTFYSKGESCDVRFPALSPLPSLPESFVDSQIDLGLAISD